MKTIFFLYFLLFCTGVCYTQDYITTIDKNEILSQVVTVDSSSVTYRLYQNADTSLHYIPIKNVLKIRYENGVLKKISTPKTSLNVANSNTTTTANDDLVCTIAYQDADSSYEGYKLAAISSFASGFVLGIIGLIPTAIMASSGPEGI